MTTTTASSTLLPRETWQSRQHAHEQRTRAVLADTMARHSRGERHPIDDFLFEYYRLRPRDLIAWHPGLGVLVEGGELAERPWYRRVEVDGRIWSGVDVAALVGRRRKTVDFTRDLLSATSSRPPQLGCFGMHEWAMVYGLDQDDVRHPSLPLRLPPDRVRELVDATGLRCTHYDAFRFFTEAAAPANAHQLTRADQLVHDQPGCLHVTMDLYKFAGKLMPLPGSDLLLDCFLLARDVRELDMAASPYDVSALGREPVRVETPEGRAAYVRRQRQFAARGEVLRERLLAVVDEALALVGLTEVSAAGA